MGRTLRYLGTITLVASACLAAADAVGWVLPGSADPWITWGVRVGAVCLGAGLLLAIVSPVGRELRRGRCIRCGAPTERGQTYCLDHLQSTVNEYRDQTRDGILRKPGGRA